MQILSYVKRKFVFPLRLQLILHFNRVFWSRRNRSERDGRSRDAFFQSQVFCFLMSQWLAHEMETIDA
jgi:hypothetical protein